MVGNALVDVGYRMRGSIPTQEQVLDAPTVTSRCLAALHHSKYLAPFFDTALHLVFGIPTSGRE
jgi:hypothetical protein